jgi:hypothetical protein
MNDISDRGRTVTVNRSLIVLPLMNDIRKGEDSNCKQIYQNCQRVQLWLLLVLIPLTQNTSRSIDLIKMSEKKHLLNLNKHP